MADIVLTTMNARFSHTSFGLRCLYANLGELQPQAILIEFDLEKSPLTMAEGILAENPLIVGLGVYIWNVELALHLVMLLKQIRPQVVVVLGGPEISFETEQQGIFAWADYVITGEAELAFAHLCRQILNSEPPTTRIIQALLPSLELLQSPYLFYTEEDILHRLIYVEASRGCPYRCAFCLSSLDEKVRLFPLEPFLAQMVVLLKRGVWQFKFVDRTFNHHPKRMIRLLEFFLPHIGPGHRLHFEMVPDCLPDALKEVMVQFPPGVLHLEVGIQSLDSQVRGILGRQQVDSIGLANLHWLLSVGRVDLHVDLIVGLPGEGIEGFAVGFDRLFLLGPQAIQVGILKRLRGVPLVALASEYGLVFNPAPPYDLLYNDQINFALMQRLRRFARYWEMIGNSGRFVATKRIMQEVESPFWLFLALSDWLYATTGRTHGIALRRLYELVLHGLCSVANSLDARRVSEAVKADFGQMNPKEKSDFLSFFDHSKKGGARHR
ncbi:MAG: DUF4080 domain-containing protein [Magnetococcus sp. DMHC-6]